MPFSVTKCIILLTLILNMDYSSSQSCKSFSNVDMLLYDRHGNKFNQDISGCITRTEFVNVTVVKAYVKNQIVLKLGKDSVRHMMYLTTVSFNNCSLEEIEPVAFRNVPSLTTVDMAFNKLKAVPKGIFNFDLTPQLELLKIDHNEINLIEDQSFYNIPNLKIIGLSNNELEIFKNEWFENTTSLEIINITFNKLTEIPKRAFINFYKIQELHFDHNEIITVQPDAFKGIRNLTYLGLSHNKLTILSEISFPNTLRITYFAINANYLTFLSNKIFKKLTAVEINMDYNPWTCPCLERINYWLYIKNGKTRKSDECGDYIPICIVPNNTKTCIEEFDQEIKLRYINTIRDINITTPIHANCVNVQEEFENT